MSFSALEELVRVARSFRELGEPIVLVGGYAVFLLVAPRHRPTLRTTEDVEVARPGVEPAPELKQQQKNQPEQPLRSGG